MDSLRYLTTKPYLNERSYTTPTVNGQQFYNLPPQVKKLINVTINVGNVLWQPTETTSRSYWDYLNTINYQNNFPSKFYVYNGQLGVWPIPSSSGNTITMNYKTRIADLSMPDVTNVTVSGTVSVVNGTTTLIAGTNTFVNWMAGNYVRIPHSSTNATNGDNQWYQIQSVSSGTTAILANPYTGATVTNGNFTIGEVPILPEDYQDLPLYRVGYIYYTTRFPDPTKSQLYQSLWTTGEKALDEEFLSKTTSVVVGNSDQPMINPNLFQSSITGQ